MNRILAFLVVTSVSCLAMECQAQRTGRLFDGWHQQASGQHYQQSYQTNPSACHECATTSLQAEAAANFQRWRSNDPYNFYDVSERYPKYYGAFHSSHFTNLGIPGGDRGFRGNGIYWTPW